MAFKGDGSRNRGSGRADSNPKESRDRSRGGGGSENRGNNPGNPNASGYLDYDTQTTTMPNGSRVPVGKMRTDYIDYENKSWADKLGGLAAGALGFGEKNPFTDPRYGGLDANGNPTAGLGARWGWDPVQTALTAAGIVAGPIGTGAGLAYRGAKALGYEPPTVDFGPSVFGGGGTQGPTSGGGLLGGGGPPRQQDNRGAQGATGLLGVGNQQAPAAATPLTAALPAQQQAAAIKKRAYDFGIGTVPGPSPYSFTTARWL